MNRLRWWLVSGAGSLITSSAWLVAGDSWTCDIGFGGLDHVLADDGDGNSPLPRCSTDTIGEAISAAGSW